MWHTFYKTPSLKRYQGRLDTKCGRLHQIIQPLDLTQPLSPIPGAFVFLDFACDEGVQRNHGRIGSKDAPEKIKPFLANLPVASTICYDAGTIFCLDGDLEKSQRALAHAIECLLSHGLKPLVFGGGHETAWGHYQGIRQAFKSEEIAVVNFDAHFDLRPLSENKQGSSGTPFFQIAQNCQSREQDFFYYCLGIQPLSNTAELFKQAKELNSFFLLADTFFESPKEVDRMVEKIIEKHKLIYLSIDLDVFASSVAPGVSAPQPFGLQPWQVILPLRKLLQSKKVVSMDIVETNPRYDYDNHTMRLATSLAGQYLLYQTHSLKKSYALGSTLDR